MISLKRIILPRKALVFFHWKLYRTLGHRRVHRRVRHGKYGTTANSVNCREFAAALLTVYPLIKQLPLGCGR
jgi:hypothetical protein